MKQLTDTVTVLTYYLNVNKEKFEPFGNLVEESLIHFTSHSRTTDGFAEQENDDLQENLVVDDYEDEKIVDFQVNESFPTASAIQNPCFSNEEINLMISQLNQNKRQIFNVVNTWARQRVQNRSSRNPLKIPPLRLFITGNAGTRKSFLIKTLYSSISKTLNFRTSSVEKPKVCALRIKYEELKMIIVDEISMVSNKLMLLYSSETSRYFMLYMLKTVQFHLQELQ